MILEPYDDYPFEDPGFSWDTEQELQEDDLEGSDEAQEESPLSFKKEKSNDRFVGVVTVQCMICVAIAIVLVGLKGIFPFGYQEVADVYQKVIWEDVNFTQEIQKVQETIGNYIDQIKPIDRDESSSDSSDASQQSQQSSSSNPQISSQPGAGGEENSVSQTDSQPPADSTYAPIVFTGIAEEPLTGRLTSAFGYRDHPVSGEEDFHKGIDIAAEEGTPIKAAISGTVIAAESSEELGNYVKLFHSGKINTLYAHCSKLLVKQGDQVKEGDTIATVGNTGNSTGSHLHFAVQMDGLWVNPLSLFPNLSQ